jgi:hypothetical protein
MAARRVLKSGRICLEADLRHLCWVLVDVRKKREAGAAAAQQGAPSGSPPGLPRALLAEKVVALLAFPPVTRCGGRRLAAGFAHTCILLRKLTREAA